MLQNVTVIGDRTFKKAMKLKWVCWALIQLDEWLTYKKRQLGPTEEGRPGIQAHRGKAGGGGAHWENSHLQAKEKSQQNQPVPRCWAFDLQNHEQMYSCGSSHSSTLWCFAVVSLVNTHIIIISSWPYLFSMHTLELNRFLYSYSRSSKHQWSEWMPGLCNHFFIS